MRANGQDPNAVSNTDNVVINAARKIADTMSVERTASLIRMFDGRNISVRDFIQDIMNAAIYV